STTSHAPYSLAGGRTIHPAPHDTPRVRSRISAERPPDRRDGRGGAHRSAQVRRSAEGAVCAPRQLRLRAGAERTDRWATPAGPGAGGIRSTEVVAPGEVESMPARPL